MVMKTPEDHVREDSEFLESLARQLSYDASREEGIRKHRLYEIAMRMRSNFYTPVYRHLRKTP